MSELIKTEAVVLSKLNYGDSSSIVTLYTEEHGKLSVIIKGGRKSKSKISNAADPPNHLSIVIYKKDTREVQILSEADILAHFGGIKSDLDKLKYAFAVVELVKKLTVEHEINRKLFKGIIKILSLLETSDQKPQVLFGRFFIFFLEELGYELQLSKCSSCGRSLAPGMGLSYSSGLGILCKDCSSSRDRFFQLSTELFEFLFCLKHNKMPEKFNNFTADRAIVFLEWYLKIHIPDFQGVNSLKAFNLSLKNS
jgi:DNA repair protein RecO (recombination protein O)